MSLFSHIEQLEMMREQMERIAQRAIVCADAFNGSEGSHLARERQPAGPVSSTINNRFADSIIAIQQSMGIVQDQINRLEQEVLANPNSTGLTGIKSAMATNQTDRF